MVSKWRGHDIFYIREWLYCDTGEPIRGNRRPCGHCGKRETEEGHDDCLGTVTGIMNACCGHGEVKDTYVQFWDGSSVHGLNAQEILNMIKEENK